MDTSLGTLLRSLHTSTNREDAYRLLPPATGLLARLTNPLNVTLLTSQILCTRPLWEDHLDVAASRRIFSVFYTASTEVARGNDISSENLARGLQPALQIEDWIKALVQGADEKSPRWRHVLLLGSVLLGLEGQDRQVLPHQIRRRLESALVRATNFALQEGPSAELVGINSIIFVLNHTFHLLSDFERSQIHYNELLHYLINATFFSSEGLQNSCFLGVGDKDILEVPGQKFGWHSNTPSFRLVEQILSRPLLSSFGPLSRLIAHAIENVDKPLLVLAALENLLMFSKATHVQWRQSKLSEIDKSEEAQFLDEETVSQTLPRLWQILRMALFAQVIILRAVMGRLMGDSILSSRTNAPKVATTSLHIFRNLYLISSRLGETSSSQYNFVSLTAIDVLAQFPAEASDFLTSIRPRDVGQIPMHPLDRCLDLFYLNIGEHFTTTLSPSSSDELLIAAASPYLVAGDDNNLLEIFEAAHSVVLAVLATPQCAELATKHLPFYIDALFSAFPNNLSARQFRLAFKTLVRITLTPSSVSISDHLLPIVLLEMVHKRALQASTEPLPQPFDPKLPPDGVSSPTVSEQTVLVLSLIDSLCYLSPPLLKEWLPLTAGIIQRIPDQEMKYVCQDRFWEAMSSGEMDVERAALCVAWWTTEGGRERTLLERDPPEERQYMMSGGLGLDSKL